MATGNVTKEQLYEGVKSIEKEAKDWKAITAKTWGTGTGDLHDTCHKCGKALIQIKRRVDPYDEGANHPSEYLIMACPNKHWYNNHTQITYYGYDDKWRKK